MLNGNFLLFAMLVWTMQTASFYDIIVGGVHRQKLQMSKLKGKKVILLYFNLDAPDAQLLQDLDELVKDRKDKVSLVWVLSGGSEADIDKLFDKLVAKLKITHPLAVPAQAAGESAEQNKLLQWLTRAELNGHFGKVAKHGCAFVVNEDGILYAVLEQSVVAGLPAVLAMAAK